MLRYVVNAVGLANPGLQALLDRNIWQQRSQPFVISVALVLSSIKKRLFELDGIINILKNYGRDFLKNIIIELNLSCPNTDVLPMQLLQEVPKYLDTFGTAGIPVILKVSVAQTEQEEELVTGLLAIQDHSALVGIHVSNTVPWKSRFNPLRSRRSPLHWRGLDADGGYSGVGAIEHSCRVVKKLREAGFTKHVTLGGGILHPDHVLQAWLVGANAISIASAFILRPWWIKEIFAKAAQLDWSAPLEERSVS
jgi:dihydroorotate dehydrogenase